MIRSTARTALILSALSGPALAQGGASASMDVSTRNMDEMIKALKSHSGKNAAQAALVLQVLRAMGQQGAGARGPELSYKVDLNPQGHLSINGLDITAIADMVNRKK